MDMSAIKEFFRLNNKFRSNIPHIAVVGDVMIDEYFYVEANRLSPEFPIPIYVSQSMRPSVSSPGGAANVAHQLSKFNVHGYLYGFRNKQSKLAFSRINDREGLGVNNNVKVIPRKIRLYNGDFPLCRWDIETDFYGTNKSKLLTIYNGLLKEFDRTDIKVVILSDYNKGFWNLGPSAFPWMKDKISIVDPKKAPIEKWKGCTIFKPNSKEAEELSGFSDWKKQSEYFEKELECRAVLMTNGGKGVRGKIDGKFFDYCPDKEVKCISVIGAGDCFVSVLAVCLSFDMEIEEAVEVAFAAGSIYVQNKHNSPVTPHEILAFEDHSSAKLVEPEMLANRDFNLCFTNGCFDILHEGHLQLLKYAKGCSNKLVVALNSDESISKIKGPNRPINNLESRIKMLSMLEFVDYIVVFEQDTPLEVIKKIKPDVLVKGGDYKIENIVGSDIVQDTRIFPLLEGKSTSNIIKKIVG